MKCRTVILLLALALPLAGCAALRRVEPDSAGVVLNHVSHIFQHPPLSTWVSEPASNYGYQTASLSVNWYSPHKRWRFTMADGYLLPDGWLPGPHEVFSAALSYTFWRKH